MDITLADLRFLASSAGEDLVAEAAHRPLTAATRLADIGALRARESDPYRVALAVELALLRRRARHKIGPAAENWLLLDDALQQATAGPVAAWRAARLAGHGRPVHDATCGIGGDLAAIAEAMSAAGVAAPLIGSDLDEVRVAAAAHNVAEAFVARANALAPVTRGDAIVLVDPARRAGGRRLFDPSELVPTLGDIAAAAPGRDVVIKCAPGLDHDAIRAGTLADGTAGGLAPFTGVTEVVGLVGGADAGTKEICLWPRHLWTFPPDAAAASQGFHAVPGGAPAEAPDGLVTRSAVLLAGTAQGGALIEQIDDRPSLEAQAREVAVTGVEGIGRYIIEPEGAIVRAGLVRHWAARHGLWQLDERIAHLTGMRVPAGAGGYAVRSVHRLDRAELRAAVSAAGLTRLDVLVRGVDMDPDELRRRVLGGKASKKSRKESGRGGARGKTSESGGQDDASTAGALVVSRVGRNAVVFLCGPRVSSAAPV